MKLLRKEADAFITVEFTLLTAIIFIVYSFLIGIGVYLYNQCILQTNTGIVAVEGMTMNTYDSSGKVSALQQKASQLYLEKYIFVDEPVMTYTVSNNQICIQGVGCVDNPAALWGIGDKEWTFQTTWQVKNVNPKETLRICKRLIKLGERILAEEAEQDE